jgi:hypothetical protein
VPHVYLPALSASRPAVTGPGSAPWWWLAPLVVVLVAVALTAARGHWRSVTLGGVAGLAVLAGLSALSAWAMVATWQDAGGYVSAAVLTGLWAWAGYYTLDGEAPPGISQRLHALIVRRKWAAVVFFGLLALFAAHIAVGWP